MEEKELLELERALQAATPAPWHHDVARDVIYVYEGEAERIIAEVDGPTPLRTGHYDAAAIADLRNAAPSLISDLRKARRLLREARDVIRQAQVEGEDHGDRCRGLATLAADAGKLLAPIRAFLGNAAAQPTPSSPLDPGEQKT